MKRLTVLFFALVMVFGLSLTANADVVFYEDFVGTGPGFNAWTTVDNNSDGLTWSLLDPASDRSNLTPGADKYAGADSDKNSGFYWDDTLISPVVDVSGYFDITLSYAVNFQSYNAEDDGYVSYSTDGGTSWIELAHWDGVDHGDFSNGTTDTWAIGDCSELQVAFRYVTSDTWQWYYQVDNFEISGNQVPIPGALWLLGSGLLGLIGIRKKRS